MAEFPITWVLRCKDEASAGFQATKAVMQDVGRVTEDQLKTFKEYRKELGYQRSAQTTMQNAWKESHTTLMEGAKVMSSVGYMGRQLTGMYRDMAVMTLGVEVAQKTLTETQENAELAQANYNRTISAFGLHSKEAQDALKELEKAKEEEEEATGKLTESQNRQTEAMIGIGLQIPGLASGILRMIPTLITFKTTLSGVSLAQMGLNTAMLANPIGIIIMAIVTLVAILAVVTKGFTDWKDVIDVFKGVWEGIHNALLDTYNKVIKPLADELGRLIDLMEQVKGMELPGVGTSPFGEGVTWAETFTRVRGLQYGGLVTEPTLALLGEREPEVVLPLSHARGVGTPSSIVLSLDSRETRDLLMGREIVKELRRSVSGVS